MAEMNSFAGNPSASRWVVTNPTPGIIRHSVRSNKKSQLLSEAASLVPSSQDLIDRLNKHALSPGDQNFFQTVLGGQVSEYLNKYTENPYFAFSREGKEKVKSMQSIVNNPLLSEAALSFEKSSKIAENAQNDRNDQNLNVVGGTISVYDQSTGKIKRVLPDHLTSSMQPLTFSNELSERTKKGFFNQETGSVESPIQYNQMSFKDVVAGINSIVGTPGSSEWNQFSQDITKFNQDLTSRLQTTYKSNASQIESKLKSIFGKNGVNLPDSYMDTLLAKEYANQYSRTGTIDREQAYMNTAKMIQDIVNGERVNSAIVSESPMSKVANDGESKARAQMSESGPLASLTLGQGVVNGTRSMKSVNGKTYAGVNVSEYPSMIFEEYQSKDGVQEGILPFNVNSVYKDVLKAPGAALKTADGKHIINEAYAVPAQNPNIIIYKDPGDGRTYLEMDVIATDNYGGDFAKSSSAQKANDEDVEHWAKIEAYAKEAYKKNPQYGDFKGESTYFGIDDQYRVRAKVEYNPEASTFARYVSGEKMYVDREGLTIGSGDKAKPNVQTVPYKR
jgi:hypothetical protein